MIVIEDIRIKYFTFILTCKFVFILMSLFRSEVSFKYGYLGKRQCTDTISISRHDHVTLSRREEVFNCSCIKENRMR